MKRRDSLKVLSSIPLIAAFPGLAMAKGKKPMANKGQAPNLVDEKDSLVAAMQYKHEASKAGPIRSNKKAFCHNCSKYNICMDGDKKCKPLSKAALAQSDVAPCQIFKGKVVKREGWCLSWSPKA